jgi:hypothetical protein
MTLKGKTKAIATATGISWLSVVISLFMLAFVLYIFASGSARVYYQLLFTSVPSTATQTSNPIADSTVNALSGLTSNPTVQNAINSSTGNAIKAGTGLNTGIDKIYSLFGN